jgi:hypothetical protein
MKTSPTSNSDRKFVRYFLGTLLAFFALNAFGGGYYGMAGAEGVPLELLEGSPFSSYFIPSLILFLVVGGVSLFASIAVFARLGFCPQSGIPGRTGGIYLACSAIGHHWLCFVDAARNRHFCHANSDAHLSTPQKGLLKYSSQKVKEENPV